MDIHLKYFHKPKKIRIINWNKSQEVSQNNLFMLNWIRVKSDRFVRAKRSEMILINFSLQNRTKTIYTNNKTKRVKEDNRLISTNDKCLFSWQLKENGNCCSLTNNISRHSDNCKFIKSIFLEIILNVGWLIKDCSSTLQKLIKTFVDF